MERIPVVSSNLAEIGYEDGTLEVAFKNGSVYQYFEVPADVHGGLMAAESHGRFLDRMVKKAGYRYSRIN